MLNDESESMDQPPSQKTGLDAETMQERLYDIPELKDLAEAYDRVIDLAQQVDHVGGQAYLVGGSVVSELIDQVPGDFDLEIHGLPVEQLEDILGQVTDRDKIEPEGKSYGVYRWRVSGIDIECSLPRRDSKTGPGHRDFLAKIEPHMGVAAAAQRRDFTIGAIYKHVLTGKIEDPYGGRQDLSDHVLRMVDDQTFGDDPLRVLRGIQLAGRYGLHAEQATRQKMIDLVPETKHLPAERFAPEGKKLFLKSDRPSVGLELARDIGFFRVWSPELDTLDQVPQDPEHHPEGSVWTHTLQVVDQARADKITDISVLLAALLHDVGKAGTTAVAESGRIISYDHENFGLPAAEKFMASQGFAKDTIATTLALISEHMVAHQLYAVRDAVQPGAFRRLARRLAPATIDQLSQLAAADSSGRNLPGEQSTLPDPAAEWLRSKSAELGMDRRPPETIIKGRDLIARGWTPGPIIGKIIQAGELAAENGCAEEDILAAINQSTEPSAALENLSRLSASTS